jgi:hypothetical protein
MRPDHQRFLLLFAAIVIAAWGVLGFFDRLHIGRGGFTYSPAYVINYVAPEGPGERAGLRVGDRVVTVAGIPVAELPLYSRWPRALVPGVGESLTLAVEREGQPLSFDVMYEGTPPSVVNLRIGAGLIGLSFMVCGLWALFAVGTTHARTLAYIGLAAGVATVGHGPFLGTWEGVASHIQFAATFLLILLVLRFFIFFPKPKRLAKNQIFAGATFGVWMAFVVLLVVELIAHPRFYHTFGPAGSLVMFAYFVLTLLMVIHTVATLPRGELWPSGMGVILLGLVVAIVPSVLAFFGVRLPGAAYFPSLLIAIPLTLALGVRKHAGWA